MTPEVEARLRDAAAEAMIPHRKVIIVDWCTRARERAPAPKVTLPTGIRLRRLTSTGSGERERPYAVQLYEPAPEPGGHNRQVHCGTFADLVTAERFLAWAKERQAQGRRYKLERHELDAWLRGEFREVITSATPPPNPAIGDVWVQP